jgi:hypothetical protein
LFFVVRSFLLLGERPSTFVSVLQFPMPQQRFLYQPVMLVLVVPAHVLHPRLCTAGYKPSHKWASAHAQVEEGTPFARRYTVGEGPLPSDEETAEMYRTASSTLRDAGYEHYEISNYAKPGHRCVLPCIALSSTHHYHCDGVRPPPLSLSFGLMLI